MAILNVRDLTMVRAGRTVLDRVSFDISAGESMAVVGPSGTGKTTLLSCLAGLLAPEAGVVELEGQDLWSMSRRQRAARRLTTIGFVYQFGELLAELSVRENVALPALLAGVGRDEADGRVCDLLRELDAEDLIDRPTAQLSGGELQRVAIARALVNEPKLVLADEPTGALDEANVEAVSELFFGTLERKKCALVVVTHNPSVAHRAVRQLRLSGGTLTEVK